MRRPRTTIAAVVAASSALLALPSGAAASESRTGIVVGFRAGVTATQQVSEARAMGSDELWGAPRIAELRVIRMRVRTEAAAAVIRSLRANPRVAYAQGERIVRQAWMPNDPDLMRQYGVGAVRAPAAWSNTRARGSGAVIAVIDGGVDGAHPDLVGKVIAGTDYVDGGAPDDEDGHGTHVAAIAAASANDGIGIPGIAPSAKILAIRVLDQTGSGRDMHVADAIVEAAVRSDVDVINLSLGGPQASSVIQQAIGVANSRGKVVVCAAGNTGGALDYPARSSTVGSECLAVGATTPTNQVASFSSRGAGLDVVAPGQGIYSATLGGQYAFVSGTSQATPHVAGVAALLSAQGYSGARIYQRVRSTARNIVGDRSWDPRSGWGLVDAAAATAPVVSSTSTGRRR